MDPSLDLQARRLFLSAALTTQAVRAAGGRLPDASTGEDLLALARSLGEGTPGMMRRYRLRFEPPYPGLTAGTERLPAGPRLVLACEAFDEEGSQIGVVFTTLIPGRLPQVSVAPAGTHVPEAWRPLADLF